MDTSELCVFLIPAAILEAIGYFILWPVRKKGPKLIGVPRQFSLADFAALLFYVQFVLAFTCYYRRLLINSIGLGFTLTILGFAAVPLCTAPRRHCRHGWPAAVADAGDQV